jgi:hypothetical protein
MKKVGLQLVVCATEGLDKLLGELYTIKKIVYDIAKEYNWGVFKGMANIIILRPDLLPPSISLSDKEYKKAWKEQDRLLYKYAKEFEENFPELVQKPTNSGIIEKLYNAVDIFIDWLNERKGTWADRELKENAPDNVKKAFQEYLKIINKE